MDISKLESDIVILDDSLLKEKREIIAIENQLEINELTTDGNDNYFEWRAKAITAINMKRAKCNSIKRQSNYWRELLKKKKAKEELELKKENMLTLQSNRKQKKIDKELGRVLHEKAIKAKKEREKEKTKRHQASENKNLKIANQFKKIIKEYLGDEKYIELIKKAENIVNNSQGS